MPVAGETDPADWYRTVRVDMAALRADAAAVWAATDAWIGSLDTAAVGEPVDMTPFMGTVPLATAVTIFVVGHANNHAGEIAALTGVHGVRGYPF